MSTSQIRKCDSCGATVLVDEDRREQILQGQPVLPWWDLAFHSSDFHGGNREGVGRTFRMHFISWDFCTDCKGKAYDAIVAAVGLPHHDSTKQDAES